MVMQVEEVKARQASAEVQKLKEMWQRQATAEAEKAKADFKQAETQRLRQAMEDQVTSQFKCDTQLQIKWDTLQVVLAKAYRGAFCFSDSVIQH